MSSIKAKAKISLLMISLVFSILTFHYFLNPGKSQSGWLEGWQYRIPITIDNSQNPNNLTDYQVLVTLDTASLISQGKMRSFCGDIRFTDSDGQTLLNYWIESGCNTNNTIIWVKVPNIPANSNKTIYVYYGNPSASSESNVTLVFIRLIDGLVASWHFDEGSGNIVYDTSGNNNIGTIYGGVTWVNGKYGKALQFDGSTGHIQVPHSSSLMPSKVSAEVWIYPTAYESFSRIFEKGGYTVGGGYSIEFHPTAVPQEYYRAKFIIWNGGTAYSVYTTSALSLNTWHYLVETFDGDILKGYWNGVLQGNVSTSMTTNTWNLSIARAAASSSNYFAGIIDELRIYNKSLTEEEILDLYNNRGYTTPAYPGYTLVRKYTSPEPTTILGSEESAGPPPPPPTLGPGWQYRIPITIDNSQNPNNLTDYQVLVTLDTASLISQGKMRSDCGDIRFTDSDGQTLLNYWLESDCNTNNTIIWVKVPNIPASSTKTIYVYYGNPNATSESSESATFTYVMDYESLSFSTTSTSFVLVSSKTFTTSTPFIPRYLPYDISVSAYTSTISYSMYVYMTIDDDPEMFIWFGNVNTGCGTAPSDYPPLPNALPSNSSEYGLNCLRVSTTTNTVIKNTVLIDGYNMSQIFSGLYGLSNKTTPYPEGTHTLKLYARVDGPHTGYITSWGKIRILKSPMGPEPTTILGSEETVSAPVGFNISSCGQITQPGNYVLVNDLQLPSGSSYCIQISSNDVEIDCQGYKIEDTSGNSGAIAIFIDTNIQNVSIKNCKIGGFYVGIEGNNTASISILSVEFNNLEHAIRFDPVNALIVNNSSFYNSNYFVNGEYVEISYSNFTYVNKAPYNRMRLRYSSFHDNYISLTNDNYNYPLFARFDLEELINVDVYNNVIYVLNTSYVEAPANDSAVLISLRVGSNYNVAMHDNYGYAKHPNGVFFGPSIASDYNYNVSIYNNYIESTGRFCMQATKGESIWIYNNILLDGCIWVLGPVADVEIHNNMMSVFYIAGRNYAINNIYAHNNIIWANKTSKPGVKIAYFDALLGKKLYGSTIYHPETTTLEPYVSVVFGLNSVNFDSLTMHKLMSKEIPYAGTEIPMNISSNRIDYKIVVNSTDLVSGAYYIPRNVYDFGVKKDGVRFADLGYVNVFTIFKQDIDASYYFDLGMTSNIPLVPPGTYVGYVIIDVSVGEVPENQFENPYENGINGDLIDMA